MDSVVPNHKFAALADLQALLSHIRRAPQDHGTLHLIVRRPETLARESVQSGALDVVQGLVGDNWSARGSTKTADGTAHPDMQITLINTRLLAALTPDQGRWPLAGDQLYVDLDLSERNLPTGTRLAVGAAVLEVTPMPHNGCKKFAERFGKDAMKFAGSAAGKKLRLRGIYCKVVVSGAIAVGAAITKLAS